MRATVQVLITEDRQIVLIHRRWRSKWWKVKCFCPRSRRRKDGTCKHEREILTMLKPEIRARARIDQTHGPCMRGDP